MMGFNHVAGGFCFTGAVSAVADLNIFEEPEYLAIIWLGSILPDIDHRKSMIGKVAYPISGYLDRHFGHRTVTHSLVCWLALTAVFGVFEMMFFGSTTSTFFFSMAYLSHLLFDMCTLSGIPFFYPFTTDRCVLPANSNLRVRSGDFRAEAIIFFVFGAINISMIDLVQDGVMKRFQATFKKFEDLNSVNQSSENVLKVMVLKNQNKIVGTVAESTNKTLLLFDGKEFQDIKKSEFKIKSFSKTKIKKSQIKDLRFFDISEDSIKSLLNHPIIFANFQSNVKIDFYKEDLKTTSDKIKLEKVNKFDFQIHEETTVSDEIENFDIDLKISKIESEISEKQRKYRQELSELNLLKNELSELESGFSSLSDYQKGKAIKRREALEVSIDNFQINKPDLSQEIAEIQALQSSIQTTEFAPITPHFSGRIKFLNYD